MRLVCLPHAGGAAALYRPWKLKLSGIATVESPELPGRGTRFGAPHATSLTALASDLAVPLAHRIGPLVLYGHSMGALLAYEMARDLMRHGVPVAGLVLAGRGAPHLAGPPQARHLLADADLAAELHRFGGTAAEVMALPELRALALAQVRADFRLVDTYVFQPGAPLPMPAVILGGADDPATSPATLAAWSELIGGPLSVEIWPGGHFFVRDHEARLIDLVRRALATWRAGPAAIPPAPGLGA
ncbi:alpha/beta fold hydrolase [Xanthobacter autotrophicus DSM 431]|uniref:thioesterase II family protein n=1 Tax=Xanthobacter nonsaccharivorans TaxID=3119912 RepID=UPI0037293DFC